MPSVLSGIGNLDRFNFIGDVLIGQPSYKKISINSETLKNPLVGRLVCLAAAVAHVALLPLATIAFLAAAILTPVPLFLLSKKENTADKIIGAAGFGVLLGGVGLAQPILHTFSAGRALLGVINPSIYFDNKY